MVEDLSISIDDQAVPREAVRLNEGLGWITLDQMETAYDRRWGFGQEVDVAVAWPKAIAQGEHILTLSERLRVSYLPFPSISSDQKSLTLA